MGFFSKTSKKEGKDKIDSPMENESPNLPSLPDLPIEYPERFNQKQENSSLPSLPSMPNSRMADEFNRNNVKDAVIHNEKHYEPSKMNFPPKNLPPIMSYPPKPIHKQRTMEMTEWEEPKKMTKQAQPLFIKLETFEKAISSFNEIKLKVSEIESLLRNIREIKNKEDKELNEWEREIGQIKSQLDQINQEIFENIE